MPQYTQGADELLPEGVYDFVVIDATEKKSHAGNPTIELELLIKDGNGTEEVRVTDYLTFSPKSFWKITVFVSPPATLWNAERRYPLSSRIALTAKAEFF